MLPRLRALIKQAEPEVLEEWNVPVWYRHGMIWTGETYKNVVNLTFAKGASLDDPAGLFNSSVPSIFTKPTSSMKTRCEHLSAPPCS
jgi:hypothetical protein